MAIGSTLIKVSCYALLVSPLIRNVIRAHFKLKNGAYRDVVLLLSSLVIFTVLMFKEIYS